MKKLAQITVPAFLLILAFLIITILPPASYNHQGVTLYSDTVITYEITGLVLYKESMQPVASGFVKAVKFDWEKDALVTIDSAVIEADGIYILRKCTQDSLFIMAYSDDEIEDFVPGYHDTTIHWESSLIIKPSANIRNANVNVNRLISQENGTHRVSGRILRDPNVPNSAIENVIVFAKMGPKFKGYGISDKYGNYHIDSLPSGDFEIIAERIGYYKDYRYIQLGQMNTDTVNFYLARVASVGPPQSRIPKEFKLYNNYPNPFNPATKIKFAIPRNGIAHNTHVKIIVYNAVGSEITVLISQNLQPGTYEVVWEGTNHPSGVYFYKLITNEYTETKKMVLIK